MVAASVTTLSASREKRDAATRHLKHRGSIAQQCTHRNWKNWIGLLNKSESHSRYDPLDLSVIPKLSQSKSNDIRGHRETVRESAER